MDQGGLKLVSEKKKASAPVSWCVYTHDTRLALLASGPYNTRLAGWQFAASGVIKLPRFELPVSRQPADASALALGLTGPGPAGGGGVVPGGGAVRVKSS
jgi:hypothetical protein